jgi:hypothetical protein
MRIHFERSGGFGGQAMKRSAVVDSATLSEEEARELYELVGAANFFALPAAPPPRASQPDAFSYSITVEDGGRQHTVRLSEADVPESLRPLLDWLRRRATAGGQPG